MRTTTPKTERTRNAVRKKARIREAAWQARRSGKLRILQAPTLAKLPWVVHGFSTRLGGTSLLEGRRVLNLGFIDGDTLANVHANRAQLVAALGAARMKLATLRQVHSAIIHSIDAAPSEAPRGDAAITRVPGLLLAVQTADCIPILLADTRRRAVAAIHAGWRGTLQRIAQKTVGRMRMAFGTDPAGLVAAIGPGIGICCYEVGPEVAQAFASQFAGAADWFDQSFAQLAGGDEPNPLPWLAKAPPGHEPPPVRARLDLARANRWQLLDAGLLAKNIASSGLCTACRTDLLFSHRREAGRAGRMMAVIGIRS